MVEYEIIIRFKSEEKLDGLKLFQLLSQAMKSVKSDDVKINFSEYKTIDECGSYGHLGIMGWEDAI